ncbi:MAG: EAL domain-containing protein [Sphingomonas sp.]
MKRELPVRLLMIDDEPGVHDFYRQCLAPRTASSATTTAQVPRLDEWPEFCLTHVLRGSEGVAAVQRALAEDDPFAMVFIDLHLPPGLDGGETARRIRALDPNINIVIVAGAANFSPAEIIKTAGPADKIFYIARPLCADELTQTTAALARRWVSEHELATARQTVENQARILAASESKAQHMANHDALTDVPNRKAFFHALAQRARGKQRFAAAILNLDRFKAINDTLGHLAGDEMIRSICAMLQNALPNGGTIARLGGDEFGLLFDTPSQNAAVATCEQLLRACAVSLEISGHLVAVSASIGMVTADAKPLRDPADLMRQAALAMGEAKRAGRGVVRAFNGRMEESVYLRHRIETGLRQAIANRELRLVYQPIVARDELEVVGFEALLRWECPEYGTIAPAIFIPIAEESSLIHMLGDWVLAQALSDMASWAGQYISINFSPRQFRRADFVERLLEKVEIFGIEPSRVQIEITETAIFDDADRAAETLRTLRQMGFRVALDDFGTGYSSLYNVRKFSLDCLKIDRSFVEGMGREKASAAIVHSIVQLGRALGLGIVAEGVENAAQVQALRLIGASHLQGYYFSRPVDARQANAMAHARAITGADDPGDGPEAGIHPALYAIPAAFDRRAPGAGNAA